MLEDPFFPCFGCTMSPPEMGADAADRRPGIAGIQVFCSRGKSECICGRSALVPRHRECVSFGDFSDKTRSGLPQNEPAMGRDFMFFLPSLHFLARSVPIPCNGGAGSGVSACQLRSLRRHDSLASGVWLRSTRPCSRGRPRGRHTRAWRVF